MKDDESWCQAGFQMQQVEGTVTVRPSSLARAVLALRHEDHHEVNSSFGSLKSSAEAVSNVLI